jgi:hypothetical protein
MTKKPKPASTKGWATANKRGHIFMTTYCDYKWEAILMATLYHGEHWRKLGYRVVRFTATEIPATTRRMVRKK